MAIVTTNTAGLNALEKISRGGSIITKSTNNPLAPGNATQLAKFATAQTELETAVAAVIAAKETLRQLISARNAAENTWDVEIAALAGVTQAVTGGDETAILSTGFGVRATPQPPQPLVAPVNLQVHTNGSPGVSRLTWELNDADTFLVECSMDEVAPVTWQQVLVTTKARCELPGADPGKVCWFRVAGVNAAGQGPWSVAIPRPVM